MSEYSYNTVKVPSAEADSTYRCKVVGESNAKLSIAGKRFDVHIREKSGSGFTIGLTEKLASRLKCGKLYELRYDDRRLLVKAEEFTGTSEDERRLQVSTAKEYDPVERWAFRLPFTSGSKVSSHDSVINSTAAYGGFVLVLFCVMALPGLGDTLGTAPRINNAINLLSKNIADVARAFGR